MATCVQPKTGIVLYLSLGHSGFNVNAEMDGFLSVAREQGLVPVALSELIREDGPLPSFPSTITSMEDWMLETCVSPKERAVIESTGGLRIVVLRKKPLLNLG